MKKALKSLRNLKGRSMDKIQNELTNNSLDLYVEASGGDIRHALNVLRIISLTSTTDDVNFKSDYRRLDQNPKEVMARR